MGVGAGTLFGRKVEPLMSEHVLSFTLNGERREMTVPANRLLIDLLRQDLGLTGTKEGCSVGVCGACSVLVDGTLLSACLLPALYVDGCAVVTIEGLAPEDGPLTPLQEAFIRHGGFQCGICTPGQIVAASALVAANPSPTRDEVRHAMAGNLCRCGTYPKIEETIATWRD